MAKEFAKKFYRSKAWLITREYIFNKYDGLCQECGRPGEEDHHIIHLTPENINNPNIALGENNLILLCRDCHFEVHRKTNPLECNFKKIKPMTIDGTYFDDNGELQQCKRYIVWGSPGAGKTTYVKQHKQPGDMIIDLDLIKQAISMEDKTEAPDNLLLTALSIREHIYRLITEQKIDAKNIWIIGALPKRDERNQLAKRLKAELIYINSNIQTCIEHVMNDNERKNKTFQREIIIKFFEVLEY